MTAVWGHITAEDLLGATSGMLREGEPGKVFAGISTDSRTLRPGELFWALKGENFDGHDFVSRALESGAAGVVLRNEHWQRTKGGGQPPRAGDAAVIAVEDTLRALGDFAGWWRRQHGPMVAAITGSSGKTTTKEMLAGILELGGSTLKTAGNFNNLIGLPLTLLRLLPEHRRAVVEMGMNRPGEIGRLTEIADPDAGVITNVGMAHLEGVGDLKGVAGAKSELAEKISPDSPVLLNGDDDLLVGTVARFRRDVITFGLREGNHVRAGSIQNKGMKGVSFELHWGSGAWPVRLKVPGMQNVMNALAAAAAALHMDASPDQTVKGLAGFGGLAGRFHAVTLAGGITLVDDTYNANPSSLRAALQCVSDLKKPGERLIVGLGEMLELGDAAASAHEEAGRMAADAGAGYLVAMGKHARVTVTGAVERGMARDRTAVAETHEEMARAIKDETREGDLILLKGSRKMGLERVVEGIRESLS
jgi:UDP-N-acetylmuramoyl-tripeptide--D-alanyl-D-alanine ligase